LQYRLSGTENSVSTASYVSGEIVITDQIPANTTYVAGSIAGSINRKTSASVAEVKEMKELKDEDGNVTGLSWTLDKLSYNDTYTLTFQVVAPDSSDDPTTPDWENTKKWSNQAQLTDMQKKDAKYPESVKVVNSDGTISQINEGDLEYTESTYQKNSNTVNHRVQDTRYGFYIQKNLKKASSDEQTFVFRIDFTPSDTTQSATTFYQTIAVPAGKTVVTCYVSALPAGTYKISEVESNWRYKLSSSSNTTLTMPSQNNKTAIFTNELETDKWESDNEDVINVMPKL
jgi:uncharacterized repeat protein (TIGR01451 family)